MKKKSYSPKEVKSFDGASDAHVCGHLGDGMLGKAVCDLAWLADQKCILQLLACQLLIQRLQAHKKRAVSKPATHAEKHKLTRLENKIVNKIISDLVTFSNLLALTTNDASKFSNTFFANHSACNL
jgi:hypothetical protein